MAIVAKNIVAEFNKGEKPNRDNYEIVYENPIRA